VRLMHRDKDYPAVKVTQHADDTPLQLIRQRVHNYDEITGVDPISQVEFAARVYHDREVEAGGFEVGEIRYKLAVASLEEHELQDARTKALIMSR
jgi:hypothetical protein